MLSRLKTLLNNSSRQNKFLLKTIRVSTLSINNSRSVIDNFQKQTVPSYRRYHEQKHKHSENLIKAQEERGKEYILASDIEQLSNIQFEGY